MAFWNGKKEETMTNEYKYEEIDFGFTAVDEEELSKLSGADTEEVARVVEGTSAEIKSLDSKLSELIEMQRDVMSELIGAKQLYEDKTNDFDISKEITEDKVVKLERLIMPLLHNLLKNKDKEYIFWPNREPIINAQIDKVLEITRGSNEG